MPVSIAYVLASALLWLIGRLWATPILDAVPILLYAGAQWVLGPLAFAFSLGAGIPGGDLNVVWAFFFLVATVLLAACLHLMRQPSAGSGRRACS